MGESPVVEARRIIDHLMTRDALSQWLGIEVLDVAVGEATLGMTVRDDMVNGFGTAHGGVIFAFADSAFAFATNAGGQLSVAVDCSIGFPVAVRPGDRLTAVAREESTTNRLAFCAVTVRNQHDVTVAHFRGTVYRTSRTHTFDSSDPSTPAS